MLKNRVSILKAVFLRARCTGKYFLEPLRLRWFGFCHFGFISSFLTVNIIGLKNDKKGVLTKHSASIQFMHHLWQRSYQKILSFKPKQLWHCFLSQDVMKNSWKDCLSIISLLFSHRKCNFHLFSSHVFAFFLYFPLIHHSILIRPFSRFSCYQFHLS